MHTPLPVTGKNNILEVDNSSSPLTIVLSTTLTHTISCPTTVRFSPIDSITSHGDLNALKFLLLFTATNCPTDWYIHAFHQSHTTQQ